MSFVNILTFFGFAIEIEKELLLSAVRDGSGCFLVSFYFFPASLLKICDCLYIYVVVFTPLFKRSAVFDLLVGEKAKVEKEKEMMALWSGEKIVAVPLGNVIGEGPKSRTAHLPNVYLPGFWPLLLLGTAATIHVLLQLLQVWSVSVKCSIQYQDVGDDVDQATHACVQPKANAGVSKTALIPITASPLGRVFVFYRRQYVYDRKYRIFVKLRCETALSGEHYRSSVGLDTKGKVEIQTAKHGKNKFDVPSPAFIELYKEQLLSPFTVFQLFTSGLWLLDYYWQYAFFTLIMICTMECVTVWQRLRSIKALKGYGMEAIPLQVYRIGQWIPVTSEDLLPGDVFSLTKCSKEGSEKDGVGGQQQKLNARQVISSGQSYDTVPCDCLLLKGTVVVNEASLTGESVPQMKEGLMLGGTLEDVETLDLKANNHRVHVLHGGTSILSLVNNEERTAEKGLGCGDETTETTSLHPQQQQLETPDGGCLACVLRTGFSSSQGKLVRMIEGSSSKVQGDHRDTSLLLLLLLAFAVCSSAYVLNHGMKENGPKRSKYELLLHCILIITSVVPPELPMQLTTAVSSSLMTLMKFRILCTEPFRIPVAGKVDVCIFDKTGTITTDELVAVGVSLPLSLSRNKPTKGDSFSSSSRSSSLPSDGFYNMKDVPSAARLVLAGCHSLVLIDEKVTGDPVESAALQAICWKLSDGKPGTVEPHALQQQKNGGKQQNQGGQKKRPPSPPPPLIMNGSKVDHLTIVTRHHFSSKLQRMSVIVRTSPGSESWVLCKGSPEAVEKLLAHDCNVDKREYFQAAKRLARKGMRVLALSYKRLSKKGGGSERSQQQLNEVDACLSSRGEAEKDLYFAGFIAYACRVRKDSSKSIAQLRRGGNKVIMMTGDALLTALHVAGEVGVMGSDKMVAAAVSDNLQSQPTAAQQSNSRSILTLDVRQRRMERVEEEDQREMGGGTNDEFLWIDTNDENKVYPVTPEDVGDLAKTHDLAVTGAALEAASDCERWGEELRCALLEHVRVFARMTPDMKERAVISLRRMNHITLMCGDGANDVGALKQAHVGVALLSGFGNINIEKEDEGGQKTAAGNNKDQSTTADVAVSVDDLPPFKPIESIHEMSSLSRLSDSAIKARFEQIGVHPSAYASCRNKNQLVMLYVTKSRDYATSQGIAAPSLWSMMFNKSKAQHGGGGAAAHKGGMQLPPNLLEELDAGDVPMIKLGDASVAAPFTSQMPSITGTVDIIRQGRCTLVTTIQMYQILATNCLNSAYFLSVLYLDGVKYGDGQKTALGMLMTVSFLTISFTKPLKDLSSVRPFTSIFHPSLFCSLIGQFCLHLGTMMYAVKRSKEYLPEDFDPDLEGEFKPNIINGVVFLIGSVQQVSVFVCNVKGPPFMSSLMENRPLLYSLAATFALVFMCASETIPRLNKWLQLEPFPSSSFRSEILVCLALDVGAALIWDRLMSLVFARKVFNASLEGLSTKHVLKLMRVIFICGALIWWLASSQVWNNI